MQRNETQYIVLNGEDLKCHNCYENYISFDILLMIFRDLIDFKELGKGDQASKSLAENKPTKFQGLNAF